MIENNLTSLITAFIKRAKSEIDVIMPVYTRLPTTLPIRWSHLLLSYVASLDRDFDRLKQYHDRFNICPLGRFLFLFNIITLDDTVW